LPDTQGQRASHCGQFTLAGIEPERPCQPVGSVINPQGEVSGDPRFLFCGGGHLCDDGSEYDRLDSNAIGPGRLTGLTFRFVIAAPAGYGAEVVIAAAMAADKSLRKHHPEALEKSALDTLVAIVENESEPGATRAVNENEQARQRG
jgi:hypothetical protein